MQSVLNQSTLSVSNQLTLTGDVAAPKARARRSSRRNTTRQTTLVQNPNQEFLGRRGGIPTTKAKLTDFARHLGHTWVWTLLVRQRNSSDPRFSFHSVVAHHSGNRRESAPHHDKRGNRFSEEPNLGDNTRETFDTYSPNYRCWWMV